MPLVLESTSLPSTGSTRFTLAKKSTHFAREEKNWCVYARACVSPESSPFRVSQAPYQQLYQEQGTLGAPLASLLGALPTLCRCLFPTTRTRGWTCGDSRELLERLPDGEWWRERIRWRGLCCRQTPLIAGHSGGWWWIFLREINEKGGKERVWERWGRMGWSMMTFLYTEI